MKTRLNDYGYMERYGFTPELKRKLIIGGVTAAVVTIAIFEKRRVDTLLEQVAGGLLLQAMEAHEAGIKYGFQLAQENAALGMTPLAEIHKLRS